MSGGGPEQATETDGHTVQADDSLIHHLLDNIIDRGFQTMDLFIGGGGLAVIIAAWLANRHRKKKGRKK